MKKKRIKIEKEKERNQNKLGVRDNKRKKTITEEMRRMPSTDAEKLEFMEVDIERKKGRLENLEKKLATLLEFVRDKMRKPETATAMCQTDPVNISDTGNGNNKNELNAIEAMKVRLDAKKNGVIRQNLIGGDNFEDPDSPKHNPQGLKDQKVDQDGDDDSWDSNLSSLGSVDDNKADKKADKQENSKNKIIDKNAYKIQVVGADQNPPMESSSLNSSSYGDTEKSEGEDKLEMLKKDKEKYEIFEKLVAQSRVSSKEKRKSLAAKKRVSLMYNLSGQNKNQNRKKELSPVNSRRRRVSLRPGNFQDF